MLDRRKQVVADGYDAIAERYATWGRGTPAGARQKYLDTFVAEVAPGSTVIDLGCGTGEHSARHLAAEYRVVGVDISVRNVEIAHRSMPQASWIVGDMASVAFRPESCDGVLAFFSLIHVPRDEHAHVLDRAATWLRPGGWLVATMGSGAGGEDEGRFLDTDMFWSSFDTDTNRRLVEAAGLELVSATEEREDEFGVEVTHLWIVARKPTADTEGR
jgi:ubiquinone/menaquinone biosynthesis C-methylase UbiE